MRLDGKIAFITGAAGGIGRSICATFLAEGACVAATDIDTTGAEDAIAGPLAGSAVVIGCDVSDSDSVRQAIDRTVAAFGRIDVLVNIAGGSTLNDGRVTDVSDDEFWHAIRLNLFGTFSVCKYGIPRLVAAGGGSVVNMSSMVAIVGIADRDCYTAAKGGVSSLTRSMAVEYAPQRVRVNAIAPGMTLTPRVGERLETTAHQELSRKHLLGLNEPEDVAAMALYLASDDSCRVTGQIFQVDSGVTIHCT